MSLLKTLLPNGLGTRGILAILLVGGLIYLHAPIEVLAGLAATAITFYFTQRDAAAAAVGARNGGA